MRYGFTLTGVRALLMHFDDIEWADDITAWRLDPENAKKKGEQSGDDRRPAHTWLGYCYRDGESIAMPSSNLSACLKKAGSRVPMGRMKTHKELAVSGIFIETEYLTFTNGGKQVPWAPIASLAGESAFGEHVKAVAQMGFKLDVRRVTVGSSKHVRVRPRFESWAVSGTLEVTAQEITDEVLRSIFQQAGRVGLGDWRPGSPKSPGPFGMFDVKLKAIK